MTQIMFTAHLGLSILCTGGERMMRTVIAFFYDACIPFNV